MWSPRCECTLHRKPNCSTARTQHCVAAAYRLDRRDLQARTLEAVRSAAAAGQGRFAQRSRRFRRPASLLRRRRRRPSSKDCGECPSPPSVSSGTGPSPRLSVESTDTCRLDRVTRVQPPPHFPELRSCALPLSCRLESSAAAKKLPSARSLSM